MSGDHNQYQKERSFLDDRREDSYVQLVDDKCDRIVWRNRYFHLPIKWVGLTDEDFLEACQLAERGNYLLAFQGIQIKLKEKNHG